MMIESITYNIDGEKITIWHEGPGVVTAEYSHNMTTKSFRVVDDESARLSAIAILGVYSPDVPTYQVKMLAITIRALAEVFDHQPEGDPNASI